MKVIAWVSDNKNRERLLAKAIAEGVQRSGDQCDVLVKPAGGPPEVLACDFVCFVGVKNRDNFRRYQEAGINWGYFDKGYIRRLAEKDDRSAEFMTYWRVAVNAHQPLSFVTTVKKDDTRARQQDLRLEPWRERGEAILIDGSSAKHYSFAQYGDPTAIARALVAQLKGISDRPIIYRPKPSWTGARPIAGTEYSNGKDFRPAFARTHVLVTYGSNLCFDAALAGVPSIVLGEGIARPISSTSILDCETPHLASDADRQQWLNNVAWCQFKLEEFRSGLAWRTMREMIECATPS